MAGKSQKLKAQERLGRWLEDLGFPQAVENHPFSSERKFELDWAWPDLKVGIEVEGGVWSGGAHGRGTGIERDMAKQNQAALEGWRIFRVTTQQAERGDALIQIGRAFGLSLQMIDIERYADSPKRRANRVKKMVEQARESKRKPAKKPVTDKAESPLRLNLGGRPLFRKRSY